MFTGLIEAIGRVLSVEKTADGASVSIEAPFVTDLVLGESVAVNGCCLTVTTKDDKQFCADVIPETMKCTTLSSLLEGGFVNLERALKIGDRLGGHFVQGHVDGVGRVVSINKNEKGCKIQITPPSELSKFIAHKGSIVLDGVSLTVSDVSEGNFEVSLVPHTLKETTLAQLSEGGRVNLEVDLLARYLENLQS